MRFSLFHLRQGNPERDNRSVGANSLTGDGYSGHVFWDTEMYMIPPYIYTQPDTVRPLLEYRYSILDKARERAGQMQGKGALFSWNSVKGEECGHVFEAATAQRARVQTQESAKYVCLGKTCTSAVAEEAQLVFAHHQQIVFNSRVCPVTAGARLWGIAPPAVN